MEITQVNNLSNNEYHKSDKYKDYWGSSNLKEYLKSPKEAHHQKFVAKREEDSAAVIFGNHGHDFMASKHVNGQPFEWNVFEPPINPSTNKYYLNNSQKYKDSLAQIKNPISSNDMELINDIWDMIRGSNYAWYFEQEILGKGIAEPSFFVEGLHKCKYRPDTLSNKMHDYKFICKKDFYGNLDYIIKKRGYHISAAMYQYFEYKRTGIWKPFILVWIMKEPPFDILIDPIDRFSYELLPNGEVIKNSGAMIFEQIKDQHELCEVSKCWPGLANKYQEINGLRVRDSYPRFDGNFDEFEIEL